MLELLFHAAGFDRVEYLLITTFGPLLVVLFAVAIGGLVGLARR